jgi:exodeoxyribonuclease VII large subunit
LDRAQQDVHAASRGAKALVLEISGQGPEKTLARGFAMVRDAAGKTVTSAASALDSANVFVHFHDGTVQAEVRAQSNSEGEGNGH